MSEITLDLSRKALNLKWDPADTDGDGPFTLRLTNGGDESDRQDIVDDGYAVVTVPGDATGSFTAELVDSDGNVVGSGLISY